MRKTIALLAGVLAASLGLAQEPSWPEVVKRKDLWPAQCTLKKSLQFQSGKGVRDPVQRPRRAGFPFVGLLG